MLRLDHEANRGFYSGQLTPLMRQYWDLKQSVTDCLLFFRMGDFYELFGQDAQIGSSILGIALTSRDKSKAQAIPMAGVPATSLESYVQKLLNAGYKVAIGEQLGQGEKLVERKILRIFSPGVPLEAGSIDPHFLAVIVPNKSHQAVLALLDMATGDSYISPLESIEFLKATALGLPIKHFLAYDSFIWTNCPYYLEKIPFNYLSEAQAVDCLKQQFQVECFDAFLSDKYARLAFAILVKYCLKSMGQDRLAHLKLPLPLYQSDHLKLGPLTAEHLHLDELFDVLNMTYNILGARQLKKWLKAPLTDNQKIHLRQQLIQSFDLLSFGQKKIFENVFSQIPDLQRIISKIAASSRQVSLLVTPKDTFCLGQSLLSLQKILPLLSFEPLLSYAKNVQEHLSAIQQILEYITQYQKPDAPLSSLEGGIFELGASSELDSYLNKEAYAKNWLAELERQEKEKTGISNLKVRYNRVFGFYIEISSMQAKNAPAYYQRKQTMAGAERFFTEPLKQFEEQYLASSELQKALEQKLFFQLIQDLQKKIHHIHPLIENIGQLDALYSMYQFSKKPGYTFPVIDDSFCLYLDQSIHPILHAKNHYGLVPNTITLQTADETAFAYLITGPNMGGKSTLMRQVALNIILGQMGSAICAKSGHWGVFSSIYTRIGAHDSIMQNQSTFMVEMSQLAHIIHHANIRSFIVIDEIGRGTSTFDGMAVAWAAIEWLLQKIACRMMISTHYHELTQMAQELSQIKNMHMAVAQNATGGVRFLYELTSGCASQSFGIEVAQAAGLPFALVQKAKNLLQTFHTANEKVHALACTSSQPLLQQLHQINLNETTPLQAWKLLIELKEQSQDWFH